MASTGPKSASLTGLLLNPTKLWIIGGISLSLFGFMGYQYFRIVTLERDNYEKELSIIYERHEKDKCQSTLIDQNEKISEAKDKAIEYQTRLDTLQDIINEQVIVNSNLIEDLRAEPAPTSCEEIGEYLRNGLKDLSWVE